jgi:hypothetical protein
MLVGICVMVGLGNLSGCAEGQQKPEMETTKQMEKAHLANFDDLDFNVYSGQKWDQL